MSQEQGSINVHPPQTSNGRPIPSPQPSHSQQPSHQPKRRSHQSRRKEILEKNKTSVGQGGESIVKEFSPRFQQFRNIISNPSTPSSSPVSLVISPLAHVDSQILPVEPELTKLERIASWFFSDSTGRTHNHNRLISRTNFILLILIFVVYLLLFIVQRSKLHEDQIYGFSVESPKPY
ncbi:hypothetical protein BLNAU_62 [Blattamonas nauphoetae]|uniref:Uncharacterized protein n=1 Tax=Blattamonas nauphoetae TaxID=2049346 RepID=A0ABQ9YLX8_9EUKA|nr:hypothetical protein BLNAU_62 [Blattamonas nauphoetae]